jgi:hypothetical protein
VFDPEDARSHYEVESRVAAKYLHSVYFGNAGGSALLVAGTFNRGDGSLLRGVRSRMGAQGDDPSAVSFWKAWEAGAVPDAAKEAALSLLALTTIALEPATFGFSFPPPLEHVALAEGAE